MLQGFILKQIGYLIIVHSVFVANAKIITNKVIITNVMLYINIIQIIHTNLKWFQGFTFRFWMYSQKKSEYNNVKGVISEGVNVGQNAFNN